VTRPFKLSVTIYSLRDYVASGKISVPRFIELMAELGAEGVDLGYYWKSEEEKLEAKRKLEELGLELPIYITATDFAKPSEEERKREVEKAKRVVDEAKSFGASKLRVHPGDLKPGMDSSEAEKWVAESLAEVVDYAADEGIVIAMENHGRHFAKIDVVEEICPPWAPAAMAASGLVQAAGALAWGYVLEKGDVLKLLPATYALETAAALLAAAFFRVDAVAATVFLLLRFAVFAGEPLVHMMAVPRLFGRGSVGSLLGIQTSVVMLSSVLAPLAGALARDAAGTYRASIMLSALLSLAATLNALPVVRNATRKPSGACSSGKGVPP
jgi:hypothetical protein